MQFILPRAIQCSSGTTGPGSAPRRPPKHQPYLNPFSHPRQSPGPSAAAGCAGGDVQCLGPSWAPTPPVGGEGLQPSPSPAAALQGEGVSPALGQLGAQLCPGSLPDRGTGEIHLPAKPSLHPCTSIPNPYPLGTARASGSPLPATHSKHWKK